MRELRELQPRVLEVQQLPRRTEPHSPELEREPFLVVEQPLQLRVYQQEAHPRPVDPLFRRERRRVKVVFPDEARPYDTHGERRGLVPEHLHL